MSRLKTIRRLLMRVAGVALVLSALTLYVVHTSPVRRFALGRIQTFLSRTQGLMLDVGDFDYNLLSSRFELKRVALRGVPLADMPAPLTAERAVVSIPVWRLIEGSLEAAQVRIDGLGVHWITATSGRSNWPSMGGLKGGGITGGPTISVTSGEINIQDSRKGFTLRLPNGHLSTAWNPAAKEYSIVFDSSGGQLQWNEAHLAVDKLQLTSAAASSGFSVAFCPCQLVSGKSRAEVSGLLAGAPPQIDARGAFDMDVRQLSPALSLATPAEGRVHGAVSASGPMDALQITARLLGDGIVLRGTPVGGAAAEALLGTETGELQIRSVAASVFSGRLTGNATIWTGDNRRRSNFAARIADVDPRQVGRAFGSAIPSAGRVTVEVRGSWPGLNWRRAAIAGVARSPAGAVNFQAAGEPNSVRMSLDGRLRDGSAARGDLALRLPDHALTGTLTGDVPSLAPLSGELDRLLDRSSDSPAVDGTARWSATLQGTLGRPSASVQAAVHGLSVGAWKGADLQVDADCAVDRIGIRRARLVWGGQDIEVHGQIGGLSANAPVQLEGTVEGRSLAPMMQTLGFAQVVEGGVSGTVRISGSVERPAVETALSLGGLTVLGERFARTTLDARWQNGALTLSQFRAEQQSESGAPGWIDASGFLDIGVGRYAFHLVGQNLRPTAAAPPGSLAMAGTFQVESHGAGALQDPTLSARIVGSDVRIAGVSLGELRGEVEAREHRATALVTAPALNARGASTAAMEGGWPFDFTLTSENTRLNTTPASSFDASVRGTGSLAQPRLGRVTAAIRNLRVEAGEQEIVSDGPVEVSYEDGRLQVERLALKSGESTLTVSGAMPLDDSRAPGAVSFEGRVVLDPLSRLLPGVEASKTGGIAEVRARLTGNAQHWAPEGMIAIHDGHLQLQSIALGVENVSGRLDVGNGIVRADGLSGKVGTGTLRIDGSLPLRLLSGVFPSPAGDVGQPARFAAHVDDLRLTGGRGENRATATFGLKIAGETSAFNRDALQATVEFSELRVETGTRELRQTAPTRITVSGGMARMEDLDAKGPDSSLNAAGSIGLSGEHPLQLDVSGDTNLASFAALIAPLEAAGRMRLEAHVRGTLALPRTTGRVELEHATFASPEPRLEATGVRLSATLAEDRIEIGELSGTLNGGAFRGGGNLKLQGGNIVESSLSISGKDAFLEYPPGVKTTSSLVLKLVARENRLILQGQIEVQDGYYDAALELFGSNPGLNQPRVGAAEAAGSGMALDLRILTQRPVEMDNNLGRLAGTADLRVAGSMNQPRVLGTLELEPDGKLYFGDRTYYIERGTVRFLDAPKLTPELNLRAYTRVGDYTVHLGLTGELKEVTTTFTSDPPLSRDDVIAVLLTGKTVAENRGVDLRALEAYALTSGAVNASLSSRLHRTLGVSRASIQPSAVAAESNPGARITITQDFTRTLRMMYSMNLSDSNDQIWVSEYDLSRRFTTRVVKESDNTYRGEFRHDIRFGSSSTKESAAARIPMPKISKVEYTGAGPFSPSDLGKRFKVKPGQNANPMRMRKGAERLTKFLTKEAYLESRVHVDRVYDGPNLSLTVRIELGPKVEMTYKGAELPRGQRARVRSVWHAGISNQQRPNAAKDALLNYFADKGYLRAQVTPEVLVKGDHKLVQFDLRPGTRYRGVKIEIEGVGTTRAQDILALLQQRDLRLSVYRDFRRASEAIARFYEKRGYLAARTAAPVHRLDAERRTGRIVIPVNEGPVFRVGALQFSGNSALTAENLRAGLPLEAGAIFEPARLEPASAALKLKYGKLGYGEADVDYKIEQDDDRASVDVSFTIVENKQTSIGEVKVEGNRHTSPDFARGQLRVASGEVANTALIRESSKNLAQTGAYASADIRLQPPIESGASDKRVQVADLTVAVAEPKPFRLLYGGLYDSGGGPGFIADFQNHNSLGAGRVLGLRTRIDPETDEVRLYVTQPFWRQHRLSTTIGAYFTRETEHDQTTPTEKLGVSIQQDLPLPSKWLLSYGYRFEKQRGFVPDPAAPDIQTNVALVAPVTFTISRDARDSFLDATRGSFVSHGFELAPGFLGSDYPYARYYVQYSKYFPLTRPRPVPFGEKPLRSRLVFASGSRLGLQKGFSAEGAVLTDRFYAGGGTTVRGFKQDELGPKLANGQPAGGNAVLVLNEELRYPLFWVFDAVTFVDVGNVFPRISDFKISELRTAAGFGLRIRNPFVVLRLDYGFKFDRRPGEKRGAFFFSIGQAF